MVEELPGVTFRQNLDDAKQLVAAVKEISDERLLPALVFVSNNPVRPEARNYLKQNQHINSMGALIVSNPLQRVIANLFLVLAKIDVPSKVFTEVDEAMRWIQSSSTSSVAC